MSYVSTPKPMGDSGGEGVRLYSQETSMKIVRLYSTSIGDVVDYKGETKPADTELLFIVYVQ